MLRCLVAAGSYALRRAANAATRGDSIIRLEKSSVSSARIDYLFLKLMYYVRALSRVRAPRAGKPNASALDPAREIDELRAALGNVLDRALGEVGEGDTEVSQLGQRR